MRDREVILTEIKQALKSEKLQKFIRECWAGHLNVFKNTKPEANGKPDFYGYGRTEDGTVIYVEGNVDTLKNGTGMVLPLSVITVSKSMIEDASYTAKVEDFLTPSTRKKIG